MSSSPKQNEVRHMKKFLIVLAAVGVFGLASFAWAQNVLNYNEQGGARQVIGGTLDIVSGGDLDIESGAIFSIAGADLAAELAILDGVTASTADLNQTTNFEQTLSSTTTVLTLTDGAINFDVASHDSTNGLLLGGTLVTATAVEINQAADNSVNVETVIATNVIAAAESGTTFFLDDTTEFVSTLPAVAAGLRYTFIVAQAPAAASYTIVTDSGADVIDVMIVASDGFDAAVGRDVITIVDANAVIGDWITCICDGTNWLCRGAVSVAAAITTGQS